MEKEELKAIYDLPFLELVSKAGQVHKQYHRLSEIQVCSLISIKTGGCPEDCKYCAQSSRYKTPVPAQAMMSVDAVLKEAKKAVDRGATRVCLGAAWREARDSKQFEDVLLMIKQISSMGVEVCCTLGMLKEHQAMRLKEAGLYAYNHNLDTSEEYYKNVITTRTYQDRLNTLDVAERATLSVCCGGILGLGESADDRISLIHTLSQRNPESVPINRLSAVPGTPFENLKPISVLEMVRTIATTRIAIPKTMIRLSSGRLEMSLEDQALCFLAGANSIFAGDKLLTVANTPIDRDEEMFQLLNLKKRAAFT